MREAAWRCWGRQGPGLGAEREEKGSRGQPALVTHWVRAALFLGNSNSGPQDGPEVGFLVSGGREQASSQLHKEQNTVQ